MYIFTINLYLGEGYSSLVIIISMITAYMTTNYKQYMIMTNESVCYNSENSFSSFSNYCMLELYTKVYQHQPDYFFNLRSV